MTSLRLVVYTPAQGWVVYRSWLLTDDQADQMYAQAVELVPVAMRDRMRYELVRLASEAMPGPVLVGATS